jgi:hypothetical protein
MTDARLKRDDRSVVLREIAGETFLVPIRGTLAELQDLFVLDGVGQWVWERLDGTRDVDDLAAQACQEFNVSPEAARADLESFLGELLDAGLVLPVAPETG